MSTAVKDGAGTVRYVKSTGDGTPGDPYIHEYKETSAVSILAALTAMNGYVDGLEAAITTLTGHQDGVEGLIGTTNTTLTTLAGYVDALETLIAATNTALSTLGGYQDGVETLIGSTNTNLTTLAGHVDGLEALVTALNGYIDGLEALTTAMSAKLPATLGQKTMANSLAVTMASDQPPFIPTVAQMTRVAINAASSGDNTIVSATPGQTIRVHRLDWTANGAVNFKWKDGAASDFHPARPIVGPGGGQWLNYDGEPHYVTTAGNALILNLSGAVQCSGDLYYTKS